MRNGEDQRPDDERRHDDTARGLPAPTLQFRRRAWLQFQRALDPLAHPHPLPTRRAKR